MTVAYATRDDVYLLGLSAQAFVTLARPIPAGNVDTSTGVVRLTAHGLTESDVITATVTTGGSLPTGLSAFVPYGADVASGSLFRITLNGVPFTSFASAGSGWSIEVDQMRRLDRHLLIASSDFDEVYTAGLPPLLVDPVTGTYPIQVVGWVARRAARAAVTSLQFDNAAFRVAVDRLEAQRASDDLMADAWIKGKPVNPRPVDQTTTLENAAIAQAGRLPVPWTTGYL